MLARIARRYGRCAEIGRSLRFSEADIAALWQAITCDGQGALGLPCSTGGTWSGGSAAKWILRELMKRPRQAKTRKLHKPAPRDHLALHPYRYGMAIGLAIGIGFGVVLGIALDNSAACIGAGAAIGYAAQKR